MVDPTEEKADHDIDKTLKSQAEFEQVTHRVLLLGTGDSGKTTIIKQMRKIHGHLEDKTKCSIVVFLRKVWLSCDWSCFLFVLFCFLLFSFNCPFILFVNKQ